MHNRGPSRWVVWIVSSGLVAALIGCSKSEPEKGQLVELYLQQHEAINGCIDVECYKTVLHWYGSTNTIARLESASPEIVLKGFLQEKRDALLDPNRATLPAWTVEREEMDADVATLVMTRTLPASGDESQPGYRVEAHWVREDGQWKMGKD
jgi:hypothetical protein